MIFSQVFEFLNKRNFVFGKISFTIDNEDKLINGVQPKNGLLSSTKNRVKKLLLRFVVKNRFFLKTIVLFFVFFYVVNDQLVFKKVKAIHSYSSNKILDFNLIKIILLPDKLYFHLNYLSQPNFFPKESFSMAQNSSFKLCIKWFQFLYENCILFANSNILVDI